MRYGEPVTRAFSIVWRFKYLWLLGILGGADVASGPLSGNFGGTRPAPGNAGQSVAQFLQANQTLIVAAGVVLLVLAVAWFLLSCVTVGALVRAGAEHDAERPFGLGPAWRAGVGTFLPILGIRLVGLAYGVVVLIVIGALVAAGVLSALASQWAILVAVIALGVLLAPVLIALTILAGLVLILGARAAVLEQRGAMAAVGRGVQLLRSRPGRVLLVWLIQLALGAGAALGVTIVLFPLVVLGVEGVVTAVLAGGGTAGVVLGAPFALLFLVAALVLAGIAGAYLSTYWTLAFRRLELDAPQPAAWPATAPPQQPA